MMLDAQHLFSDAQALTATAASTNLIDLGADRDIGKGEPMAVVICVDVAADFTTANETYQIDLETDDNSSFSSATVIARRIPVVTASAATNGLAAGKILVIPVPHDNERYLRLNYTLGGTTPTVTLTSFLQAMSMIQSDAQYPDALTIS